MNTPYADEKLWDGKMINVKPENPVLKQSAVNVTVPGRIRGKGRPKFARRGAVVHAYTPADTANCEAMVRSLAHCAMIGRAPFEGPLVLDVTVTINTPGSWSKKRKAAAFYVTGKPDVDNMVKLIGDAFNGIVWIDDSQVCDLHFGRRYRDGVGECIEIKVYTPGKGEPVSGWIQRRGLEKATA